MLTFPPPPLLIPPFHQAFDVPGPWQTSPFLGRGVSYCRIFVFKQAPLHARALMAFHPLLRPFMPPGRPPVPPDLPVPRGRTKTPTSVTRSAEATFFRFQQLTRCPQKGPPLPPFRNGSAKVSLPLCRGHMLPSGLPPLRSYLCCVRSGYPDVSIVTWRGSLPGSPISAFLVLLARIFFVFHLGVFESFHRPIGNSLFLRFLL